MKQTGTNQEQTEIKQIQIESPNIYKRLLMIQNELGVVAKNLSVSTGKSSYKAVSERDVIDAVKPLEAKYGVYSYPYDRDIIENELVESERKIGGETVKATSRYMRLRVVYRFVNIDNPEEFVDITTYGDGIDSGDKATGKAMTYADKYALMKAYKISTGDDPDQEGSNPNGYTRVKKEEPEYPTPKESQYLRLGYSQYEIEKMLNEFKIEYAERLPRAYVKQKLDERKEVINQKIAEIKKQPKWDLEDHGQKVY